MSVQQVLHVRVTGRHRRDSSRVVVLIPARNEEAQIGATIAALHRQDRAPEHLVVVCDRRHRRGGRRHGS
ncbi:MAG TPA: hypothetical protein VJ870_04840 [Amycolatopsis sp.]|nr:hypothetical protein [Amycolatopsis sp.]